MHSIKGLFKHKSKSENFLNDLSDEDEKANKKKLKELKKANSKKSNTSLLKNLSRHSSRISNIGLENESSEKLKEVAIANDVSMNNNESNERLLTNSDSIIHEEKSIKNDKKESKVPHIRTLKEIGTSVSMPVFSPMKENPYHSEDEESNVTQKSKKELKKEQKREEKKKKEE